MANTRRQAIVYKFRDHPLQGFVEQSNHTTYVL